MIYYNPTASVFQSSMTDASITTGFGTKQSGNAKNISQVLSYFHREKFSYRSIVLLKQIHSINTHYLNQVIEPVSFIDNTDALVTKLSSTILLVKSADCLPLIYFDKKAGLIGISHNGWRGTVKKITHNVINLFIQKGAQPEQIKVLIGPGINQCCYEIGEDHYYSFKEEYNGYSDKIFKYRQGKIYLNLLRLNYLLLLEKQIRPKNIDYFPFCTSCNEAQFYSFRRGNRQSHGEMFSFILRN